MVGQYQQRYKVYPRVCGGTWILSEVGKYAYGLSPRVRGNPSQNSPKSGIPGSIPACAGEPTSSTSSNGCDGVYPRVCGGTMADVHAETADRGLSPRVRGNLLLDQSLRADLRSIPACAGEPCHRLTRVSMAWVYPRVCGGTRPPRI